MSKRSGGKKGSAPGQTSAKRSKPTRPDPDERESASSGRSESAGSERSVEVQEANFEEMNPYFMAVAHLFANLSKDPDTKVGACIVNEKNQIVGVGYNKLPVDWTVKQGKVRHAEDDAIRNRTTKSVKECRMFVTLQPCYNCALLIKEQGISKVIYMRSRCKNTYRRAEDELKKAKIKLSPLGEKAVLKIWQERLKNDKLA